MMNQDWCYQCEEDLDPNNKYELEGAWGAPSGDFVCEPCAEGAFDSYMESRIA